MCSQKNISDTRIIAQNPKSRHDYHLEAFFEAGLMLQGWEVKAIRALRVQMKEAYIVLKGGEAFVIGLHISPLLSASTHISPQAIRTRKLLLKRKEIDTLIGKAQIKGYALVPTKLYFRKQLIKLEIALGKGKKLYDKRQDLKEKEWARDKQRLRKESFY